MDRDESAPRPWLTYCASHNYLINVHIFLTKSLHEHEHFEMWSWGHGCKVVGLNNCNKGLSGLTLLRTTDDCTWEKDDTKTNSLFFSFFFLIRDTKDWPKRMGLWRMDELLSWVGVRRKEDRGCAMGKRWAGWKGIVRGHCETYDRTTVHSGQGHRPSSHSAVRSPTTSTANPTKGICTLLHLQEGGIPRTFFLLRIPSEL